MALIDQRLLSSSLTVRCCKLQMFYCRIKERRPKTNVHDEALSLNCKKHTRSWWCWKVQLCGMSLFLQWLCCRRILRATVVNLCENRENSRFSPCPILSFVFSSSFDFLPALRSPSSFSLSVNEFAHQNNCRFNLINRCVNQVKMCEWWQRTKNLYDDSVGTCKSICLSDCVWEMIWADITSIRGSITVGCGGLNFCYHSQNITKKSFICRV